ncbi:TIM21-domain-containing protein [Piptocephalis cylindrospora]|uniref:Mitochondrial import inner membrane translocase subunit Tim21 n=1 Tax=Piptocephalis cylindrospora TaxID=1907219 RepID=A0A4P9Y8V0_9FUNG|nr:TIM21-domain-containing protein [Piptocephalis cylindrospora]|eukprot:RKP14811.1 TIM21-domain-containing protein [Piptocephalis cylindrospora]
MTFPALQISLLSVTKGFCHHGGARHLSTQSTPFFRHPLSTRPVILPHQHGLVRSLAFSHRHASTSTASSWPRKALNATTTSASALIILGGLGVCGGLLYLVGSELFSSSSPSHLFSQSLKLLQDHPDITARFGEPLRGYGEPSSSRAQRNRHVMAQEFLDPSGYSYWRMRYYIVGPKTHPSTSALDTLLVYWDGLRAWIERSLNPPPSPSLPIMKEEEHVVPQSDQPVAQGVVHISAQKVRSGWSITEMYVDVPGLTDAEKAQAPPVKKTPWYWPSSSSSSSSSSSAQTGPHRVYVIQPPTFGFSRAPSSYLLYQQRANRSASKEEDQTEGTSSSSGVLSRLSSYFRPSSSSS